MKLFADIETIPQQPEKEAKLIIAENIKAPATMKKQETIDAWHDGIGLKGKYAGEKDAEIEKAYRSTSFDASKGEIATIAWAVGDGEVKSTGAYGGNTEADVLKYFFDSILIELRDTQKVKHQTPYFIGHFIGGFDLRFLWRRAVILKIQPPFKLPFDGWHDKDFFCTQSAWCGKKGGTISMDNLAKALGIEGKAEGMDGSKVWDAWKAQEFSKVLSYNECDVKINREIYDRITFGDD